MAKTSCFIDLLKKQGYKVIEKALGGGYVNKVSLVIAHKGDQVCEYVLKKYKSKKDAQDMIRGYNLISSVAKTPTISYYNGNEAAYDLIKGKSVKDMIVELDPKAPEAVRLLAKELEKLHKSKNAPPRYRKHNSPDEKKMLGHIAKLLERKHIGREEANHLAGQIRKYVPKNKSIIHGDAHLGNFLYSKGEIYFIDPDNVKLSDYNVDISRALYAIEKLGKEGKISPRQASELGKLFLTEYKQEDITAVNLYKTRTPLIEIKRRCPTKKEFRIAKKAIRNASKRQLQFA